MCSPAKCNSWWVKNAIFVVESNEKPILWTPFSVISFLVLVLVWFYAIRWCVKGKASTSCGHGKPKRPWFNWWSLHDTFACSVEIIQSIPVSIENANGWSCIRAKGNYNRLKFIDSEKCFPQANTKSISTLDSAHHISVHLAGFFECFKYLSVLNIQTFELCWVLSRESNATLSEMLKLKLNGLKWGSIKWVYDNVKCSFSLMSLDELNTHTHMNMLDS